MLKLLDGPTAGTYRCERAPIYLRAVVRNNPGPGRDRDVLDQTEDVPEPDETVFVYRREGEPSTIIACGPGGAGGLLINARYHHLREIEGEAMRDTDAWRTWAQSRYE